MRKLAIAYGSSRKAKTYRNDFITDRKSVV